MRTRFLGAATAMSVALITTMSAGAALAQQNPPPGQPGSQPGPPPRPEWVKPQDQTFNLEGEAWRRYGEAAAQASAARKARAGQLAALVDAGKCDEAFEAAKADRDFVMARRVKQVCKAPAR